MMTDDIKQTIDTSEPSWAYIAMDVLDELGYSYLEAFEIVAEIEAEIEDGS